MRRIIRRSGSSIAKKKSVCFLAQSTLKKTLLILNFLNFWLVLVFVRKLTLYYKHMDVWRIWKKLKRLLQVLKENCPVMYSSLQSIGLSRILSLKKGLPMKQQT